MPSSLADPSADFPKDRGQPSDDSTSAHSPGNNESTDDQATSPGSVEIPDTLEETVISKQAQSSGGSSSKGSSIAGNPLLALAGSPAELGRALLGESLGYFRLEEFVGGGGMGAVFRATDTMLSRTVAVKVLSRDRTDAETRRRFRNEAQSAARLDHDNIARVYYVGEDKGLNYIVFEFIEGTNVRDLVDQNGPLPLDQTIRYILQVAEALEHASQRDVVHRDIKPSNVLVTLDGHAKLVDMGLARLHQMESESEDLTASGVTLGTFDYISPEQARDPRAADVRSDLYSLGCTMYYMLTGRPPFPEGTVLQKLLSHSSETPSDPRHVRPDLDEQVVKIINKLLAKQPNDRFQEPGELVGELLVVADRLGLGHLVQKGVVWSAQRKRRFSRIERMVPWLLPMLTLVIVAAVLNAYWSSEEIVVPPPQIILERPNPLESNANVTPDDVSEPEALSPVNGQPEGVTKAPSATDDDPAARPGMTDSATSNTPSVEVASANRASDSDSAAPAAGDSTEITSPAKGGTDPADDVEALSDLPIAENGSQTAEGAVHQFKDYIVVRPRAAASAQEVALPENAEVVYSLGAACRAARELGIDLIELHFDGEQIESPIDIASSQLTIQSAPGYDPRIVFQPALQGAEASREMIRVIGGSLQWHDVDVQMELPSQIADGWALFDLQQIEQVDIVDSVLTIRKAGLNTRAVQGRVAFFQLTATASPETPNSPQDPPPLPPYLGLQNCIVRGEASALYVTEATAVRFIAKQSLIVTTDRLVDVEGTTSQRTLREGGVEVGLKKVTAVLGRGLCRLSSSTDTAPNQVKSLTTTCEESIVLVSNSQAALIERRGADDLVTFTAGLRVKGRDNFYPGSDVVLRINPDGDASRFVDFTFEDLDEPWYEEKTPRFAMRWQQLPTGDVPVDLHTALDYQLDSSENNPARLFDDGSVAGVDVNRLPATPEDIRNRSTILP